jgi:acyl-CoA hydrolase
MSNPLTRHLAPGQRVFVSAFAAESALLGEAIAANPECAAGVTFIAPQFPGIDRVDYLALHPRARLAGIFMSPALRRGLAEGRAELLPHDYLGAARHFACEMPPPDVAIAHLTPPDAEGYCSAGLGVDFMPLVWPRAGRRIAHLNPRLPRTRGSFRVHMSELQDHVLAEAPVLTWPEPAAGEVEARIGAALAAIVRDGDTLQFGIGSIPVALAGALKSHRRLAIHGGMVSESLRTLWDAGALDREVPIITGVVLGNESLHTFVERLPNLWLTDVRTTHDPAVIIRRCRERRSRFVAINSAVEVDLFGQVNSERAAGVLQAGAGGLPAFAQAAQGAEDGRLMICLPATAKGGQVSRIVPALGEQGLATLPRTLADTVVTEYGAAEVRSLTMDARARALIDVAAPQHREALAAAWGRMRRSL